MRVRGPGALGERYHRDLDSILKKQGFFIGDNITLISDIYKKFYKKFLLF